MSARFARKVSAIVLVIVLSSSLALSWSGLTSLAEAAGYGSISFLLALTIDGTVGLGSLAIVTATAMKTSPRFGWSILLGGAVISTFGNVLGSGHSSFISGFAHALPPIAFALGLESWLRVTRRSIVVAQAIEARAEKAAVKTERAVAASLTAKPPSRVATPTTARVAAPVRSGSSENLEEARRVVEALGEAASDTARARAVLGVLPTATGRQISEALEISLTAGHKARGRALAVRSIA